jgi:hypothetical protein
VIVTGAEAVIALVLMAWTVPVPVIELVPATNKVEPLSRPTVALDTLILGLMTGTAPLKSTKTTLGVAVPPHPVPQFRIKARVSLALNTPIKG